MRVDDAAQLRSATATTHEPESPFCSKVVNMTAFNTWSWSKSLIEMAELWPYMSYLAHYAI